MIAAEGTELERALLAMDAVLDGQIDAAERLTATQNLVFPKIATGVLHFIQATVGFEAEAIHRAVHSLSISEAAAAHARSEAESAGLVTSSFRPGAEYELGELESALLGAISMLLTEGKLEILKALYKIRKTYLALEELRKHVEHVEAKGLKPKHSVAPGVDLTEFRRLHHERTQRSQTADDSDTVTPGDTIEEYVRSGVEACAGLLHLILSSVPPNISRLLSVVGLHGEREVALSMLWHASTEYRNIHGSLALLALLMFFDGQLQYKDIELSPEEEAEISKKYGSADATKRGNTKTTAKLTPQELRDTKERLMVALRRQRVYYPHGVLWLLQEGRLVTHDDLHRGVSILESPECGPNQMRQVEGLLMFDRTMFLLSLTRLEEASTQFIALMDVSTWSHPLYMYMAAACQLELYRACEDKTGADALRHKKLATEYLTKAPHASGKKKVLGRKMPFDTFVARKVEAFQRQAAKHKLDLVDAVDVSPLYEALYFWNGPSRMSKDSAEFAIKQLGYSAKAPLPESSTAKFTRNLLEAVYMRRAGRVAEGFKRIEALTTKVVSGDVAGTGNKKVSYHEQGEPWAGPAVLYERAVYEWLEFGKQHANQVRRWLKLVSDWPEDYELSTRINFKVTGAQDRLDIYRL